MEQVTVRQLVARIYELMGTKLRVGGRTLEDRVRKAGRLLPKDVRVAAQTLVTAEKLSHDPKMSLQLDPGHTSAAYARCVKFLERIDPAQARVKALFTGAASILLQLLIVLGLAIAVLRWQGFI